MRMVLCFLLVCLLAGISLLARAIRSTLATPCRCDKNNERSFSMADAYDPLRTKWATLSPGTTAQKLAALNTVTVQTSAQGTLTVTPSQILNAIVPADFLGLTQLQVSQLTLLLAGGSID